MRTVVPDCGVEPNVTSVSPVLYRVADQVDHELGHEALVGGNQHLVGYGIMQNDLSCGGRILQLVAD